MMRVLMTMGRGQRPRPFGHSCAVHHQSYRKIRGAYFFASTRAKEEKKDLRGVRVAVRSESVHLYSTDPAVRELTDLSGFIPPTWHALAGGVRAPPQGPDGLRSRRWAERLAPPSPDRFHRERKACLRAQSGSGSSQCLQPSRLYRALMHRLDNPCLSLRVSAGEPVQPEYWDTIARHGHAQERAGRREFVAGRTTVRIATKQVLESAPLCSCEALVWTPPMQVVGVTSKFILTDRGAPHSDEVGGPCGSSQTQRKEVEPELMGLRSRARLVALAGRWSGEKLCFQVLNLHFEATW